jgi:hypothetical protein
VEETTGRALHIGAAVRPQGALHSGTIGCFARRDGVLHLVTCDHVIKSLPVPEAGPWRVFPPLGAGVDALAVFEGASLASAADARADLAAARVLGAVAAADLVRLPAPLPRTRRRLLRGLAPARAEREVLIWSASAGAYQGGRVAAARSAATWAHGKYGPRRFAAQFAVAIDAAFVPAVGDSGGPVLGADGRLVGFLAALACTVTERGVCLVHCVPAIPCLAQLDLQPLVAPVGGPKRRRK